MINKEEKNYYKGFKKQSERFVRDSARLNSLLQESQEKAEKYRNQVNEVWDSLQTMIRLVKSWINGSYRNVPYKTILSIVTAIVYFVSPLDALPDFIVGGFIDDITIIGWIIGNLQHEIHKFKSWEHDNKDK